jgi:threonine synthase
MDQISSERGFGSKETSAIVGDITKLIGNTPMTRLNRVTKTCLAEVAVKLEVMQPTMSIKDRMALGMIAAAEDRYSRFISTHHVQLTVALKLSTEAIYAQERQR